MATPLIFCSRIFPWRSKLAAALPSSARVEVARPRSRNSSLVNCARGRATSRSTEHLASRYHAIYAPVTSLMCHRPRCFSLARSVTISHCGMKALPMMQWSELRAMPASKTRSSADQERTFITPLRQMAASAVASCNVCLSHALWLVIRESSCWTRRRVHSILSWRLKWRHGFVLAA